MFASAIIGALRSGRPAGAGVCARCCLGLLLMLAPVMAGASAVSVATDADRAACTVHGTFRTAVPDSLAWAVLTDYDHIDRFVRSMKSSRVEHRNGDTLRVRQDAVGSVLLFHRRVQVLLEVREQPISGIEFRDVLGKDFKQYTGTWSVARDSTGCRVAYTLRAEPTMPMPKAMCRGMLKHTAQDLLEQVRDEMVRRAGAPHEEARQEQ